MLFRWSGPQNAHSLSDADGAATGLVWARYFDELRGTAAEQNPSVLSIAHDGERTLLVAIRDAANQATRHDRIDADTGEIRGSLLPLSVLRPPTATGTDQPPQLLGLNVATVTTNLVTLNWTTDQECTAQVVYGLATSVTAATLTDQNHLFQHSVSVGGLTANTTYWFKAVSTDRAGQTVESPFTALVTACAPVAPATISNVTVASITETTLQITWSTSLPSTSQVTYGSWAGSDYVAVSTPIDRVTLTDHAVTFTGLVPGRAYSYFVTSIDETNNEITSARRASIVGSCARRKIV